MDSIKIQNLKKNQHSSIGAQGSEIRVASLFLDKMEHGFRSLNEMEYSTKIDTFKQEYPLQFKTTSQRFHSPYQIYVAVGSYPERLEGRDAIFLEQGQEFLLKPKQIGSVHLNLGASSFLKRSDLSVALNGKNIDSFSIPAMSPPVPTNKLSYKFFDRYWKPDPETSWIGWQDFNLNLELAEDDELSLVCEGGPCLVSELIFYKQDHEVKARNVLFILVDTLRAEAISPIEAPFLTQFSRDKLRFKNAIAAGNMTSPSTNAMLSCQSASQLGSLAFSYAISQTEQERFYQQQKPSFPSYLRMQGKKTAMIGNISVLSEVLGIGLNHGFSEQIALEKDAYDTPQITRAALSWMTKNTEHPFFLYLHYHAPHAPYKAPLYDLWKTFPGMQVFSSYANILRWLYQAEVYYTDRYLKILIKGLEALKLGPSTDVVISADHGDHHELRTFTDNEAGPSYTGTYFDHGATLYNDEIHIPLIFSVTNLKNESIGGERPEYVSGLDIGPSLLAHYGIPVPPWCEGRSLLTDQQEPETLSSEGYHGRALFLPEGLKYIRSYAPVEKRLTPPGVYRSIEHTSILQTEQLFDLKTDPLEQHNLAKREPFTLNRIRKLYNHHFQLKEKYELVIEAQKVRSLKIAFSAEDQEQFKKEIPSSWRGTSTDSGSWLYTIPNPSEERVLWSFSKEPIQTLDILIDNEPVPLLMTSLRLPLNIRPSDLPLEKNGDYKLLPIGKENRAYIRKVEEDSMQTRRIETGNSEFENILREWGYLNDTN